MPVLNHPDGSPITSTNPLPVSGSFSIASEIEIKNDAGSPVPVNGTVALDTATLAALENTTVVVSNLPTIQTINGTVSVSNLPATQAISGTVELGSTSLAALENTTVVVSNFPASQVVSGSVGVSNFPATQAISGSVGVNNFPTTQVISGSVGVSNFPATQAVSGSVGVSNFPATQVVSGSVSVGNFPATQTVSVSNFPATQPVSGSVSISNTPSVAVNNFPTTQAVSGTVAISGSVNTVQSGVGTAVGTPFYEAQVVAGAAVSASNPLPIISSGSNLGVSGTTAAAAGATITLAAGAAGLSHYIDSIDLVLFTSTARAGTATPVSITSTNLNGWGTLLASSGTLGAADRYQLQSTRPLKSAVAATATTITLPSITGGIWRYNVTYSLAV